MRINKIQQSTPNFQKIKFSDKAQTIIKDTVRKNLSNCNEAKADYINKWKFKIDSIRNQSINMFALGEKSYNDFDNECLRSYGKSDRILEDFDIVIEDIEGFKEEPVKDKGTTVRFSLPQLDYKNECNYGFLGSINLFETLDMIGNVLPTQIKTSLVKNSPLTKAHKQHQLSEKELNKMIDNLFA